MTTRRKTASAAVRHLLTGALAGLALLFAGGADAQIPPPGECTVCSYAENDTNTMTRLASRACRYAKQISCEDRDDCWSANLTDLAVKTNAVLVSTMPSWIACGASECKGPLFRPGIIIIALFTLAAIFVLIATLRVLLAIDPWHGLIMQYVRIALAYLIIAALGTGFAEQLWSAAGLIIAIGANVGARLTELTEHATIIGCHRPASAALAWDTVQLTIQFFVRELFDMAAIIIGIASTLLPHFEWFGTKLVSKQIWNTATFDPAALFEVLRMLFTFTLATTTMMMATGFIITIFESLITLGIGLGLSPITAFLAMYRPTRGAAFQALAAVLHATLVLLLSGLCLAIGAVLLDFSLDMFYDDVIASPEIIAQASATGAPCPLADVRELGLRQTFNQYVHLIGCSTDNLATVTVQDNFSNWLPGLLLLIVATTTTAAILRYSGAIATELTQYQTPTTGTAQAVQSGLRQAAQTAWAPIRSLLRR